MRSDIEIHKGTCENKDAVFHRGRFGLMRERGHDGIWLKDKHPKRKDAPLTFQDRSDHSVSDAFRSVPEKKKSNLFNPD